MKRDNSFFLIIVGMLVSLMISCSVDHPDGGSSRTGNTSAPTPTETPAAPIFVQDTTTPTATPGITQTPTPTATPPSSPVSTAGITATPTPSIGINGSVYIGGYYKEENKDYPALWIDNKRYDLDMTEGCINDVAVSSLNVYSVGYTITNGNPEPCYWINDVKYGTPDTIGMLNAIYISGSDIYVAGYTADASGDIPCVLINGTYYTLDGYGRALDIIHTGTTFYISGYTIENDMQLPVVWVNSSKVLLDRSVAESGTASSLIQADNYIVIGGSLQSSGMSFPVYWVYNGSTTTLYYNTAYTGVINSIAGDLQGVYGAGFTGSDECGAWLLNSSLEISRVVPGDNGLIHSTCYVNDSIYYAGYTLEGESKIPMYWSDDGNTGNSLGGFGEAKTIRVY